MCLSSQRYVRGEAAGCNIYVSRVFFFIIMSLSCWSPCLILTSHSRSPTVSHFECECVYLYEYLYIVFFCWFSRWNERAMDSFFSHAIVTWWVRWDVLSEYKNKTENYEATSSKVCLERARVSTLTPAPAHSLRKKKINKRFNFFRLLPCYCVKCVWKLCRRE